MPKRGALIFGLNEYSQEIAKNVANKFEEIGFYAHTEDVVGVFDGAERFDFSEEWGHLQKRFDMHNSTAFCTLQDTAENIFLTISLRSTFKDLTIIAIAQDKESANKLTMAGANKVIPLVQTTAKMIADMLTKPVITEILHDLLYEKSNLKIVQLTVSNAEFFHGKTIHDVEWHHEHGVVIISIMHENLQSEFIYSSKLKRTAVHNGDILVVVGYEYDLSEFKKLISREDV